MQLCFIDEAGDLGVLGDPPAPNDQPVLAIAGLFVDTTVLGRLTDDFLDLKHRFFPDLNHPPTRRLDRILPEIKGAELRKHAIRGNARKKRRAIGFHNVHVQSGASRLRSRYGLQLKQLQHRYYERGRYVGGVTVADHLNQRSGALMFGSQGTYPLRAGRPAYRHIPYEPDSAKPTPAT